MDERRLNIEEWLRQAANRQQGGRTSEAEKQQAWQQLHSMLDVDGASSGGRSWMGMVDIIVLFVMGVLLVLPGMYSDAPKQENVYVHEMKEDVGRNMDVDDESEEKNVKNGDAEDGSGKVDDEKNAKNGDEENESGKGDDEKNAKNGDRKDGSGRSADEKDVKSGDEKNESGKGDDEKNAKNGDRKGGSGRSDEKDVKSGDEKNESGKGDDEKNAKNGDRKDGSGRSDDEKNESGKGDHEKNVKNGDRKNGSGKSAKNNNREDASGRNAKKGDRKDKSVKSNDEGSVKNGNPRDGSRKNTEAGSNEKSVKNGNEKNDAGINIYNSKTNQEALSALSTQHLFPAKIAKELSHAKQHHIPYQSSPTKINDLLSNAFSLNLSLVLPADGQYGANLAAEYNYRLWHSLFIRPRAGIAYVNAGTREYSHSTYFPRADTIPNPIDPYWVDSLVTNYSVKGILYGVAGLQVAYRYKKLEIFTGIAYRHQFILTGTDSSYTKSKQISGTPPVYQRERFSRNRLPGKTNLQWQAGLNYMLNRHLQVGASYNILLQKSAGQKGLNEHAPAMPVSSSVELQLRWFFRKK